MLNHDFNLCFGRLIIPCIKLSLIFVFVFAFFAMVRLRRELDLVSFAFVSVAALTAAALGFPISIITSSLFDYSSKFKQHMLPCLDLLSNKLERKHAEGQVRACQLIRYQVGNLYHMEAKAKLTLIHEVVNFVVFLFVNVQT